jgi:hypothetical protein
MRKLIFILGLVFSVTALRAAIHTETVEYRQGEATLEGHPAEIFN